MSRTKNPTGPKPDKPLSPVKLDPPQVRLLRDTARYIVVNAIRRNPALTAISGEVPFKRTPLTDGAIRAARDVVQTTVCNEQIWPGKQIEVESSFERSAPEADSGQVKFKITPKPAADG